MQNEFLYFGLGRYIKIKGEKECDKKEDIFIKFIRYEEKV